MPVLPVHLFAPFPPSRSPPSPARARPHAPSALRQGFSARQASGRYLGQWYHQADRTPEPRVLPPRAAPGQKNGLRSGEEEKRIQVSEGGKGATPPRFARTLPRSGTKERKMGCLAGHGASASRGETSTEPIHVRRSRLQSRPTSRRGDNSSPYACASVGNYRPCSQQSTASRYDEKRGRP